MGVKRERNRPSVCNNTINIIILIIDLKEFINDDLLCKANRSVIVK